MNCSLILLFPSSALKQTEWSGHIFYPFQGNTIMVDWRLNVASSYWSRHSSTLIFGREMFAKQGIEHWVEERGKVAAGRSYDSIYLQHRPARVEWSSSRRPLEVGLVGPPPPPPAIIQCKPILLLLLYDEMLLVETQHEVENKSVENLPLVGHELKHNTNNWHQRCMKHCNHIQPLVVWHLYEFRHKGISKYRVLFLTGTPLKSSKGQNLG